MSACLTCDGLATCPGCFLPLNGRWDRLQHPLQPRRISGLESVCVGMCVWVCVCVCGCLLFNVDFYGLNDDFRGSSVWKPIRPIGLNEFFSLLLLNTIIVLILFKLCQKCSNSLISLLNVSD